MLRLLCIYFLFFAVQFTLAHLNYPLSYETPSLMTFIFLPLTILSLRPSHPLSLCQSLPSSLHHAAPSVCLGRQAGRLSERLRAAEPVIDKTLLAGDSVSPRLRRLYKLAQNACLVFMWRVARLVTTQEKRIFRAGWRERGGSFSSDCEWTPKITGPLFDEASLMSKGPNACRL